MAPAHPFDLAYWGQAHVVPIATNPYNSDASAADTVATMRRLTLQASQSPLIRSTVHSLLRPDDTQADFLQRVFWWVKSHVVFAEDEYIAEHHMGYQPTELTSVHGSIDLLISPVVLLEMQQPYGDCDDFSMLIASLLICADFKVWFVTVAVDPSDPNRLSHIYVKTIVDGKFVAVDASHGKYVGWEAQHATRRVEWEVN